MGGFGEIVVSVATGRHRPFEFSIEIIGLLGKRWNMFNHLPSRFFIVNVAGEIAGFSKLIPDIPARPQQTAFTCGSNQGGEGDLPFRLYRRSLSQMTFHHTRAQAVRELEALDDGAR